MRAICPHDRDLPNHPDTEWMFCSSCLARWPTHSLGHSRQGSLAGWKLVESRDGNERSNVTWPDGGEVAQVHCRDGDDPEPLTDRDHRRIRAAKPEVSVLTHEAGHPPQVGIDEVYQLKGAVRPHAHAVQEGCLCRRP